MAFQITLAPPPPPPTRYLLVTSGPIASEFLGSQPPLELSTAQIIDLKGHCTFCLDRSSISNILNVNWGIPSLRDIWPYIQPTWNDDGTASEHIFIIGQNVEGHEVISRIPPLCTPCLKEVERIVQYHKEIVILKKQLETLEKEVVAVGTGLREKMRDETEGRSFTSKLEALLQMLNGSAPSSVKGEKTNGFLNKLRGIDKTTSEDIPTAPEVTNAKDSERARRKRKKPAQKPPYIIIKNVKSDLEFPSEPNSDSELEVALENVTAPPGKLVLLVEDASSSKPEKPKSAVNPNNRAKGCEICGKEVLVKNMYSHMHSHIGDYTFKCPNSKCKHAYLSRWSHKYYNHLKKASECTIAATGNAETSLRKMKKVCETCGEECDILHRFGLHLKRHESGVKKFHCPITDCGKGFTVRQNVEYHLHMDHDRFRAEKNAQLQLRTCHVCEKKLPPDELANHLNQAHNLKQTLLCKICSGVFGDRESLIDHLVTHSKQGVKCDMCHESTVYYKGHNLREHYFLEHQIGKKLQCEFETCGYTCFTDLNLRSHKWRHHEGRESKPYKCDICEPVREYSSKSSLTTHNIKVHGAKPMQCQFCDDKFTAADQLWKHEREHRGIKTKTYMCNICDKSFKLKNSYDSHLLSHSSERKFKCRDCDKEFKQASSLRHHQKTEHLGVRYFCETCGNSFKNNTVLRNHQRIHTGERPFHCTFCNLAFRQRSTWRTHVMSHKTKGEKFVSKGTFDKGVEESRNRGPRLELV